LYLGKILLAEGDRASAVTHLEKASQSGNRSVRTAALDALRAAGEKKVTTTRRAFLATMPAAVLAPLRSAEPDFERIDTHTHIHRTIPALLAAWRTRDWKALSICDSRELGDEPSTLPR
jgi:hypothetical protein